MGRRSKDGVSDMKALLGDCKFEMDRNGGKNELKSDE